jgi:hypothetical protein
MLFIIPLGFHMMSGDIIEDKSIKTICHMRILKITHAAVTKTFQFYQPNEKCGSIFLIKIALLYRV